MITCYLGFNVAFLGYTLILCPILASTQVYPRCSLILMTVVLEYPCEAEDGSMHKPAKRNERI